MTIHGINTPVSIHAFDPMGSVEPAGSVDPCGALLPAPSVLTGATGDIGAEIALLSLRAGQDEEQINSTAERAEDAAQDAAEQSEVGEMRTEANDIMNNAYAAGAMQICQGALQITGACAPEATRGDFSGGATLCAAGSAIFNASGQAAGQLDQSIVTSYKAVADRAGQMAAEASQAVSDARSVITNALEFYREYQQTASQVDLLAAGQKA